MPDTTTIYTIPYHRLDIMTDLPATESHNFLSNTFRGGFGHVLRSVVCITPEILCEACDIRTGCLYHKCFGILINGLKVRPYTLRTFAINQRICIIFTLLADETASGDNIIRAFEILGTRGVDNRRYRITSISQQSGCVYPQPGTSATATVFICMHTPLGIKKSDNVLNKFNVGIFLNTLINRYVDLAARCNNSIGDSPPVKTMRSAMETFSTITDATRPRRYDRWSTRQEQNIRCYGVIDEATIRGDTGIMFPLLAAGQIFGVGKSTVMGNGWYSVRMQHDD